MAKKKPFKSDTAKIVERHMKDPNHEITEDEIRSVRVGMTPPLADNLIPPDEKVADRKSEDDDESTPGHEAITPWDTISDE